MKLAIIGIVFLVAIGVLVWVGVVEGGIPVLSVQELKSTLHAGQCRIDDGLILSIENDHNPLEFTIRSESNPDARLSVSTQRTRPDNFKAGNKVSVRGVYDPVKKKFIADEVLTACPSRYEESGSPALMGTSKPPASEGP